MKYAGIDIGSRTVKLAVLKDGQLVLSRKAVTSYSPLATARELMEGAVFDRITATGYGRHVLKGHLDCPVISEITAFAQGAQVYATLRARSTALRTALLTNAQGKANELSERMVVPGSLLGVVFIALLVTPPLLRLLTS